MDPSEVEHFSKIHRLVTELVRVQSVGNNQLNEALVASIVEYICDFNLNPKTSGCDLNILAKKDTFSLLKTCEERISTRYNDPKFSQFLHLFNQFGDLPFACRLIRFLLLVSDNTHNVDPRSRPIRLIDSPSILFPTPDPPSLNLDTFHDHILTPASDFEHSLDESSYSSIHVPKTERDPRLDPLPIEESDVISNLLEILQGRDSSMFTLTRGSLYPPDSFVLKPTIQIPAPFLNLCFRVGELGCCYRQIQQYLEEMNSSSSIFSSTLIAAVRSHIEEYTEYISLYTDQQTGAHTLRSLLLFVLEPMYSLKRICSRLEKWKKEKGGTLVSMVYEAASTGCPKMRRVLSSFLAEVLIPLQSLVHRWICLGEIETQHSEDFFIKQNPVSDVEIWEKGYKMDLTNLPEFITLRLANKILLVGKTLAFLRNVCDESEESFFSLANRFENSSLSFESIIDGTFDNIIHELFLSQSAHLLQILNDKFNIRGHLKGFREYFLLSRGEFVFPFLDQAKPLLDGPANLLNRRDLKDIYFDSLQISPARLMKEEVLNRLDVELIPSSDNSVGWDVFNIDYILTPPLDTVFPPPVISSYQCLFRFVLTVRNCEYSILDLWKSLNRYDSPSREDFEVSELFYLSHFIIISLLHFIRKLEYFISYDIFACEWEGLCEALDGCRDFDHLRVIHQHYLDLLKIGCFISPIQKNSPSDYFKLNNLKILKELNSMFQALLENIKLAEKTFKEMFADFEAELEAKRATEERINSSGWGMSDSIEQKELEREGEFMNKMELIKRTLHIQYSKFSISVQSFVMHIYKNPIFGLKRLAISLNYSGFYRVNKFIDLSNKSD